MKGIRNVAAFLLHGILFFLLLAQLGHARDINTVAGGGTGGDGGTAIAASLNQPSDIAVDGAGSFYIADSQGHRIRKVDANGNITTVAGNGNDGFSGDNGSAVNAELQSPVAVAVDGAGNLYIADAQNARIRKVDSSGIITTVAGNGVAGFGGDGGLATTANINHPQGVAVDNVGNLYIADAYNNRIRKVDPSGIIRTIAGSGTSSGANSGSFSGDSGPAVAATLNNPGGIAVDGAGDLYIADTLNNRIRKVDAGGTITTVAGAGGFNRYDGDNGPAASAHLSWPNKIAVDTAGNLYITDTYNGRIRMVDDAGNITTLAGNGDFSFGGDGGLSTDASLKEPYGVAVDGSGDVYIADTLDDRIRCVKGGDSYTLTIAPAGTGAGATSGAGTYSAGQIVTVSATAETGSTFAGWSGIDGAECATGSVTMTADKSCTATFTLNTYTLTLSMAGSGSGTVSGGGTYSYGQSATVAAVAKTGSTFAGWSGADGAECATGSVTMTADKSCTATFALAVVADTIPPVIIPPANIIIAATSASGALVTYPPATATDNMDPSPVIAYSQASGTLFPIGVNTVTVTATDSSGNSSTASFTITVQSASGSTAQVAPSRVYLSNHAGTNSASMVFAIDPVANVQVASIPMVSDPQEMAFHPDGSTLYVITGTDISVIDVKSDTEITHLSGVSGTSSASTVGLFQDIVMSPDGSRLYLLYRLYPAANLAVDIFDTTTPSTPKLITKVTSTAFNGCYGPLGMGIRPDGSKLYMACRPSNSGLPDNFYMMDTQTNAVTLTTTFPRDSSNYTFINGLVVNKDGSRVYLVNDNTTSGSTIQIFDGNTGLSTGFIALPSNSLPKAGVLSADGSKLYVVDQVLGTMVIDTASDKWLLTMPNTSSHGRGFNIALNPDGVHLYTGLVTWMFVMDTVTNGWDASVTGGFAYVYQLKITPGGRQ